MFTNDAPKNINNQQEIGAPDNIPAFPAPTCYYYSL